MDTDEIQQETSTASEQVVPLNDEISSSSSSEQDQGRPKLKSVLSESELKRIPPLPPGDRKCTDVLFLVVFLVYWIGMLAIGYIGFRNGDPNRLIYGSDHKGEVCGGLEKPDQPFIVYPRTSRDIVLAGGTAIKNPFEINFFGVCASKCPSAGDFVCTDKAEGLIQTQLAANNATQTRESIIEDCIDSPLSFVPDNSCVDADIRKGCYKTLFNTTSVLFRCFPRYVYKVEKLAESGCTEEQNITRIDGSVITNCLRYRSVKKVTREEPTDTNLLFDSFNTVANLIQRLLADLVLAYPVILATGVGMSVAVGLIYASSLWCCVGLMVWLSIVCCILLSILFTMYCYFKAGFVQTGEVEFLTSAINDASNGIQSIVTGSDVNTTDIQTTDFLPEYWSLSDDFQLEFEIASYCLSAFTVFLIIVTLVLGKRIRRAIEIFKEASHAVKANPAMIAIPPISMSFMVAVVSYWAFSTAYIASSGEYHIEELNTTVAIDPETDLFEIAVFGPVTYNSLFLVYLFLGVLWTAQFLNGIGTMTIAGTVGSWYWGGSREDRVYGYWPVLRSFYTVIRFHLGTVAFGGLLVAIIQLIRYVAAYIQARSERLKKNNRVVRVIFCCLHCFLKCVETCVKFVSRNSFIMVALYGESFCASTRQAFFAIASNLAQVATVTFLGDIIMRFGQIMITALAGISCWVYIDSSDAYGIGGEKELSSFLWPVVLAMLLAWFIGAEVLSIYDITVDTILLSYCQDKKLAKYRANYKEQGSMRFATFVQKHRRSKGQDQSTITGEPLDPDDIANIAI